MIWRPRGVDVGDSGYAGGIDLEFVGDTVDEVFDSALDQVDGAVVL